MKQLFIIILLTWVTTGMAQEADVIKSDAIMQESVMQYRTAAELYEKAAHLYEANGQIDAFSFFKAGQNYVKVKSYAKALTMLEKAQANNYEEANLYAAMGDAQAGLKQFDKAEQTLLKGKKLFPDQQAEFTKKLGYLYFNSRQYDQAVECLNAAIQVEPNNYTYHYLLGSSYERLKDYQLAATELEKVVALHPNHKNSIKKLGVIYFKLTNHLYEKETKRYEALKSPTRMDYHNSTQKLEEIALDYKKSLPYLEKAHSFSPKDKAIIACLSVAYRRLKMEEKAAQITPLLK
ncbi:MULTISPECIES: tetratricopeptide repeat protein [unclassified Carboxylicivirga]|uniref:tetratricopeptide repeat protein n=1 Tax=Carboxylicivirga TaxID=1628153 RepID=UPI003D34F515